MENESISEGIDRRPMANARLVQRWKQKASLPRLVDGYAPPKLPKGKKLKPLVGQTELF